MLRSIWFLTGAVLSTLRWGVPVVIASYLRVRNRENGIYERTTRGFGRSLLWASGVRQVAKGLERVPENEPVIFVSNHQSAFDIFLVAAHMPGRVRFTFKKELMKVPVFGQALKACGHIKVDRQNRSKAFGAFEDAARVLNEGISALIFAEGTRSRTGELLPFKKGAFVLAIGTGVKIVPVYCGGTFDLLRKGSVRLYPRRIGVFFGEPINTAGLDYNDRNELMERTRTAMEELRVDSQTALA